MVLLKALLYGVLNHFHLNDLEIVEKFRNVSLFHLFKAKVVTLEKHAHKMHR